MLLCRNQTQHITCNTPNRNGARDCTQCGRPLQNALYIHDADTTIRRYRIVRMIGHSNDGAVYEVEVIGHPHVHVALKERTSTRITSKFAAEFAVLSQLRHPNLPRYYELFEQGRSSFLVMDFIPGQSLHTIAQRQRGPLAEQLVFGYADQICEVLSYLHSHSPPVLHRNIKPSNILLTAEGQVKLVDFGLARQMPEDSASGTGQARALDYTAPEQWLGDIDTRSDIYSLGATLYHLLSGKRPQSGVCRRHTAYDMLHPPAELNPQVTAALSALVMRAMDLASDQRFATVAEMHQALLDVRRQTVTTRTLPPLPKARPPEPPRPAAPARPLAPPEAPPEPPRPAAQTRLLQPAATRPLTPPEPPRPAAQTCLLQPAATRPLTPPEPPRPKAQTCLLQPAATRPLTPPEPPRPKAQTSLLVSRLGATQPLDAARLAPPPAAATLSPARARTIRPLLHWPAHTNLVNAAAWSQDGRMLASAGSDGRIVVWSIAAGGGQPTQLRASAPPQGSVLAVAWSPDGRLLANGGRAARVVITRASDGHPAAEWPGHASYITALAWSPDGQLVASAGWEGVVRLWRASDGHLLAALSGHTQTITSLSWSPDSRQLASSAPGCVRIWDVERQQESRLLRTPARAQVAVTWAAAGTLIAFGGADGRIQIQTADERNLDEVAPPTGTAITALTWSPDSQALAYMQAGTQLRLWERGSGEHIELPGRLAVTINSLAWHPGGKMLAGVSEGRHIHIWEVGCD